MFSFGIVRTQIMIVGLASREIGSALRVTPPTSPAEYQCDGQNAFAPILMSFAPLHLDKREGRANWIKRLVLSSPNS